MEQLHEHNQRTYENICRMYGEGIQRVAVVQPTGSGKSLLMAKLIEDNPDSRFFVLSTSHKINDQFKAKLDEETLKRIDFNIYCNMPNMNEDTMKALQPDYILLDEMHRALAKEWSKGIKILLEMYPNAKVLGLSATPIRYLDRCRNVVEELINGNLACDMSLSQAILDGILPMARYVCGVYSYEKDTESLNKKIEKSCNSDEEKKELLKELKILKENLDKGHGVSDIFRKYIMSDNEKFVVFLKNTTHLKVMKPVIEKWFIDAGFSVRLFEVHSKNIDKDKEFQAFKEDTEDGIIKLCLSVNMIAEGIHGDIDGVIMLRETMSPNLYFQMIGRAFSCGKKTIPLIFDLVANSQFISDAVDNFPNELRGEIEKRKEECEKEGKDYEVGFNVDEFIVMDEFMDVVSGFRAIEGRLIGSWDLYIKALKQYKEREGDCNVSQKHIEIVDNNIKIPLGNWMSSMRSARNGKGNALLTTERIRQLNELGFIWDELKYKFENKVKLVAEYYKENGKYPSVYEKDFRIKELVNFLRTQKTGMRKANYPIWKENIIKQYLPDFSYEYETEKSFNKFIYYAGLYKEKYGHTEIKGDDAIDGFKIGMFYTSIKQRKNILTQDKVKKLEGLGINLDCEYNKILFEKKLNLVKEAIENDVVISRENQIYNHVNLYEWIKSTIRRKYKNGELLNNEIAIIESLLNKPLYKFFNKGRDYVHVMDVIDNVEIAVCSSRKKAAEKLSERLNIYVSESVVYNRVNGKVTTPYKGRFMFYYVTDEEVKKYLEENKASQLQ